MESQDKYLGVAIKYPLQLVGGRPVYTSNGREVIEEAISSLLSTVRGSRFFLPEWGSRLEEAIGEQADSVLESLLRMFIDESITTWEKRVNFEDVTFDFKTDVVNCKITYRVLASNEIDSFIYPFYKELKY